MDTVCNEATPQPLRVKVWVLKVSIHCEGCKRKVKKVLQSIDGVYTTTIDSERQKVTVTGNVNVETLIKRLVKAGKHAVIWPESPAGEKKRLIKPVENEVHGQENGKNLTNKASAKKVEFKISPVKNNREQSEKSKNIKSSTKKSQAGEAPPVSNSKSNEGNESTSPAKSGAGQSGDNKRKKKGQLDNNNGDNNEGSKPRNELRALNLDQDMGPKNGNPLAQQVYYAPKGYFPPPLVGLNYHSPHSANGSESFLYHVPQIPFPYPNDQTAIYQEQAKTQNCLEYFSEENANGCLIM